MKWLYFIFSLLVVVIFIPPNDANAADPDNNLARIINNDNKIIKNQNSLLQQRQEISASLVKQRKKIESLQTNGAANKKQIKTLKNKEQALLNNLADLKTTQKQQNNSLSRQKENTLGHSSQLTEQKKILDTQEATILLNSDQLTEQKKSLSTQKENILLNSSQLIKQETTISNHSAELISQEKKLTQYSKDLDNNKISLKDDIDKAERVSGGIKAYIDRFWVLIAAVLVFFMQAGFKTFEAGMVRKAHDDNVAIKNILDWLIICIVFYLVGFAFMFGESWHGLIGTSLFSPDSGDMTISGQNLGMEFFLYQLAFAATAATIVSGAMSERMALIPYVLLSIFIGSLIYPIVGHWIWGGTYLITDANAEPVGWLASIGFRDFAGSTVVHSVGAWIALAGVIAIGPRHGRYNTDGSLNTKDFQASSFGYSALGVFILWFGWWGFNGGSGLEYNESISLIILNTTLAGAAAGITAFFQALSKSRDKNDIFPKLLGGILGGLVAITACCNVVTAQEAILIGMIAGLIHNYSYDFLMVKCKLDDPVGAIAVHGFCGVWGTLSVGFFGDFEMKGYEDFFMKKSIDLFSSSGFSFFSGGSITRPEQILIQLFGVIVIFIFTFLLATLFFKLIRLIPGIGLRVTLKDEKEGNILGIRAF
jgi:Amt family ammonium transporter